MSHKTAIIEQARNDGRLLLTEVESKMIIAEAGIETINANLAKTKKEAIAIASEIGFPVALKIVSPDVAHKSDKGGVVLGLKSKTEVGKAYSEIITSIRQKEPKATITGVSVQRMARPGIEVIMGMSKDDQFGPVLMFGLGGVFVEVLKDVSFRIVPILPRDADQMIREIKGFPVLQGYRGLQPAKIEALENMLMKLSDFVDQTSDIKELDLNPVFAYDDGAVAVDARIVLEPLN